MALNRTKIDWPWKPLYTWNPVTGCLNGCPYCYARKIAMHFEGSFKPKFHKKRLLDKFPKKPANIFVCSMADLFGDWINQFVINDIIAVARNNPKHQFIFLTKNPARMNKFAFPENAWVGVTVETKDRLWRIEGLQKVDARYRFISFEPLLGEIDTTLDGCGIDLVIIGGLTGEKEKTKREWDKIRHHNKFYKANFRD